MDVSSYYNFIGKAVLQIQDYIHQQVLSWAMGIQIIIVAFSILLAHHATAAIRAWFARQQEKCDLRPETCGDLKKLTNFLRVIRPFLAFVFVWIALSSARHLNWSYDGLETALILLVALFLARLLTDQMKNRFWARILEIVIWFWASLYVFHIIDPWHNLLNHIDFTFGKVHVSLLTANRALLLFLFLYWLSRNLLLVLHFWLMTSSELSSAVQLLLYRLCEIFLFSASVIFVLHFMGIDLTVFAVFSGALGLGIGFGLQKVFANLISGFVILADKSIKPGDVIQIDDKYGWINYLGSRYISVVTRDSVEYLVPNEELITGKVINWSYSNNLVRLKMPVGIAYGSNLDQAMELMIEAAKATPRVMIQPEPACLLVGFGESSVNFEIRVWIADPQNGVTNVKSMVLLKVWQRFKDHGIELPFPQRVLHHKSMPELDVCPEPEKAE